MLHTYQPELMWRILILRIQKEMSHNSTSCEITREPLLKPRSSNSFYAEPFHYRVHPKYSGRTLAFPPFLISETTLWKTHNILQKAKAHNTKISTTKTKHGKLQFN